MPKFDIGAIKAKAGSIFDGFTRGQKTVLGIAVVALLLGGFLFTKWSSAPSYTALYSNLSAKDASEVTQQLTTKGVSYQLADNGATVLVPRAEVYQLRLDLSSQGLPSTGQPGYALLDKQGITTSEFRQRIDYQRALEGELSNTLGAIEGVAGATVHLVIPKDDLFSKDASKPTASVLIQQTGTDRMDSGSVQTIVHLVASSVEGLSPDDVTVADGQGRVLSTAGEEDFGDGGGAQAEQTTAFESRLAKSIEGLLVPVVGTGHAVVTVNAALDFDRTETTSETYGKGDPVALAESLENESYVGEDPTPEGGGILGPDGDPAEGEAGNYQKESVERQFAPDKVIQQVRTAPGAIERLSVAVVLDAGTRAVDQRAIEDLVSAAAGIDRARGDVVQVKSMRFDTTAADAAREALEQEKAAENAGDTEALLRTLGAVLIVALVLFFAWRSARRASIHRLPIALPTGAIEITSSVDSYPLEEAFELEEFETIELEPPEPAPLPTPREFVSPHLAELIDNQPEDVAQMLRGWMADRRS